MAENDLKIKNFDLIDSDLKKVGNTIANKKIKSPEILKNDDLASEMNCCLFKDFEYILVALDNISAVRVPNIAITKITMVNTIIVKPEFDFFKIFLTICFIFIFLSLEKYL